MRLSLSFRYAVYAAIAVLMLTGAGWLLADWQKNVAGEEIWQQFAATMLMVHGGVAMLALLLLGALVPVHLLRAWRSRRNRISGTIMASLVAILIVTAFGLYYLGPKWCGHGRVGSTSQPVSASVLRFRFISGSEGEHHRVATTC